MTKKAQISLTGQRILLLNGPNLNLLGHREPHIYGHSPLSDIVTQLAHYASQHQVELHHFQSNAEHELIDKIHQAQGQFAFIIINPAAFSHTSIALRDALIAVDIPFIEVHLSNIYAREPFRHHSYLADIACGTLCGLGSQSYYYALQSAIHLLSDFN